MLNSFLDKNPKSSSEIHNHISLELNLIAPYPNSSSANYNSQNPSDDYVGDSAKMLSLCQKYQINLSDLNQIISDTNLFLNNNK